MNFKESIVFLGDSIIEEHPLKIMVLSYLTWASLGIPTINLGVGSSNTVQEFYLAKAKILPSFNMKLLVLGFCLNDIEQNLYRRFFNPSIGNWQYFDNVLVENDMSAHSFSNNYNLNRSFIEKMKTFLKKSEAFLFVYRIWRKVSPFLYYKDDNVDKSFDAESWKNTEYFIKKISKLVYNKNSDFIVIIFPTRDQIEGITSFDTQEKLKDLLLKNNIKYFDPAPFLINQANQKLNLFYDTVHPNQLGTQIIAKNFVSFLNNNFNK